MPHGNDTAEALYRKVEAIFDGCRRERVSEDVIAAVIARLGRSSAALARTAELWAEAGRQPRAWRGPPEWAEGGRQPGQEGA